MKSKLFPLFHLLIFCLLLSNTSFAGHEKRYPVSAIPDSLKKSAVAVIRNERIVFDIKNIQKATMRVTYVVTILKKAGIQHSYFVEDYDRFKKVSILKGVVYDAAGDIAKKIKSDDIHDVSMTSGSSLFVDNRLKAIDPEYLKLPFTVEYVYEVNYNGLLNYPDWYVYKDYNVSVQHASFTLEKPADFEVRILNRNFDAKPEIKKEDDREILTWKVNGIKALKKEPFSEPLSEYSPSVQLAPADFLIDGYKGNCETWKNFGKWIYTLGEGKDELPEETKEKINSLISDAGSDYERAEILYKYLQDNTRYVNITIGIGGWQPIDASTVDKVAYGDCKALTNYMKSLLEVAGIESFYTLVKAGSNASKIISDFPSNQFNHAILCALIDSDSVWLECTSQRLPFGYIGSFTDDRDVLLVNAEGGTLVRTTKYSDQDNRKICTATIDLDNDGNAWAKVSTQYKGYYYDRNLDKLLSDEEDKKKLIREGLHLPDFMLENYSLEEEHEMIPSIFENLELAVNGCGTPFGNRMVIKLNLLNKVRKIPTETQYKRKSDIVFHRSFMQKDSITYKIPDGFQVEKVSPGRDIKSEFGELNTVVYNRDSLVSYVRTLTIRKGDYPPESYGRFVDFYKAVKKADNDRMILVAK